MSRCAAFNGGFAARITSVDESNQRLRFLLGAVALDHLDGERTSILSLEVLARRLTCQSHLVVARTRLGVVDLLTEPGNETTDEHHHLGRRDAEECVRHS